MKQIFTIIILFFVVSIASATETKTDISAVEHRIEYITKRVEEIKAMDKSTMSNVEKAEMKSELKSLKKEAKEMGLDSRLSISIGALIIILLLLIIIL